MLCRTVDAARDEPVRWCARRLLAAGGPLRGDRACVLVRQALSAAQVREVTTRACKLAAGGDGDGDAAAAAAVAALSELKGVGPATASAVRTRRWPVVVVVAIAVGVAAAVAVVALASLAS
eukprot:scaffold724_cov333-Prasinococcus_capsulatus_cf.AAC.11